MEDGGRPRSHEDLMVVVDGYRTRSVRGAIVSFVVVIISTLALFLVDMPGDLFPLVFVVMLLSVIWLLGSVSRATTDISQLPFAFSETLRLSLYPLAEELDIYVRCTSKEAIKKQGAKVRRPLITVSRMMRTWGGTVESGVRGRVDFLTDDLRAFSDSMEGFLERINYKVKRNQPVKFEVAESLWRLVNAMEMRKDIKQQTDNFMQEVSSLAEGDNHRDPDFIFSLGSYITKKMDRFYEKWKAELLSLVFILIVGVCYVAFVQSAPLNLDDNTKFLGAILIIGPLFGAIYSILKRKQ